MEGHLSRGVGHSVPLANMIGGSRNRKKVSGSNLNAACIRGNTGSSTQQSIPTTICAAGSVKYSLNRLSRGSEYIYEVLTHRRSITPSAITSRSSLASSSLASWRDTDASAAPCAAPYAPPAWAASTPTSPGQSIVWPGAAISDIRNRPNAFLRVRSPTFGARPGESTQRRRALLKPSLGASDRWRRSQAVCEDGTLCSMSMIRLRVDWNPSFARRNVAVLRRPCRQRRERHEVLFLD